MTILLSANQTLANNLTALQASGLDRLDAQLLLLHVLGKSDAQRGWLLAHDTDLLPAGCAEALSTLAHRRLAGEPLAYLTGSKSFYGLNLQVNADVLVPRSDTETLVDWALEVLSKMSRHQLKPAPPPCPAGTAADTSPAPEAKQVDVLDLGTGSGAIALAIKATRPDLQVWATDLSAAALAVAQANAQHLQLDVQFSQGAWFAALPAPAHGGTQQFAVIVSNPPYIADQDEHLDALNFEPPQALTSGIDGLDDLCQITANAKPHLKPGGWLLLEHGYNQAEAVRELLTSQGFDQVQSRYDLAGIERCSGGQKPLRQCHSPTHCLHDPPHPMNPTIDIDERLTNLEIKASFTEDLLDKLDEIIIRQQDQIDRLTREVLRLSQPAPNQDNAPPRNPRDELPPHY
ncbi:MAG: peptide chain release factor N(5)-glutamine methyltransferase [Comamonadaceae bacterium]|nr:peptide chain release factor N(5)-glutamine methyltransferase [Comamonadaceae bacterium]